MKTNLLIILILTLFLGCNKQTSTQITPQQQETAKQEISAVVNKIIQSLENRNAEALFQPYSDSIEFICITTDASKVNLEEFKKKMLHGLSLFLL